MDILGRHAIVEYLQCDPEKLSDVEHITRSMLQAATASGATIITHAFHHFSPYGVSGAVIIAESHLSIHTWPEYGYAAVDLFTCGTQVDPRQAYAVLKRELSAADSFYVELKRGQLCVPSLQHTALIRESLTVAEEVS
jgi:S-adenosylmethionine decarboxylase proenzyme